MLPFSLGDVTGLYSEEVSFEPPLPLKGSVPEKLYQYLQMALTILTIRAILFFFSFEK